MIGMLVLIRIICEVFISDSKVKLHSLDITVSASKYHNISTNCDIMTISSCSNTKGHNVNHNALYYYESSPN